MGPARFRRETSSGLLVADFSSYPHMQKGARRAPGVPITRALIPVRGLPPHYLVK